MVQNPVLVQCSYRSKGKHINLSGWQSHQTIFLLDLKDLGLAIAISVTDLSDKVLPPGGTSRPTQKVDNAVTSLLDLEPG